MERAETLATYVRTCRPDTVHIRLLVPQIQSFVATRLLLDGVDCTPEAKEEIEEWCEAHADADRLRLITPDFFRDTYGRLLGDLADPKTGECLTDYLIDIGVAQAKPQHYLELVREMLTPGGPEA
jgi:hypothetical protein